MKNTVLAVAISSNSYLSATEQIINWAKAEESRTVFAANVHMVMEAHDDHNFCEILNKADMVTSDGMPLVWLLWLKGNHAQKRVYGPTLMLNILGMAEKQTIPVGLYGSSPKVLEALVYRLEKNFPKLKIVYKYSPPYIPLSEIEEVSFSMKFNQSGARILFVGLGCPKQEKWISAQKGKVNAVMVGVGAAFDFHAGVKPQSPPFLQRIGLEWLFRLFHEPRRLWKRYLFNNPRFIVLAIADLLGLYHLAKMK